MTTSTIARAKPRDYTASELLAVMAGRLLRDGQVVFAGVGMPLLASAVAFTPSFLFVLFGGPRFQLIRGNVRARLGERDQALEEIASQAGRQFDPDVVKVLLELDFHALDEGAASVHG